MHYSYTCNIWNLRNLLVRKAHEWKQSSGTGRGDDERRTCVPCNNLHTWYLRSVLGIQTWQEDWHHLRKSAQHRRSLHADLIGRLRDHLPCACTGWAEPRSGQTERTCHSSIIINDRSRTSFRRSYGEMKFFYILYLVLTRKQTFLAGWILPAAGTPELTRR